MRDLPRDRRIRRAERSLASLQGAGASEQFRFIDLFAGIGGFRSGMTAAGGTCVFTSEWDRFAAKTYSAWYGDEHVYTGDIRALDADDIPEHEVLCAGFPCQPFSIAGVSKKNSLGRAHGFDDEKQGNLFFKIMEIANRHETPILFLENVKNLKSHDKKQTWKTIESLLSRNYHIFDAVLDAAEVVPQHRERVFIVCFRKKDFPSKEHIKFAFPNLQRNRAPRFSDIMDHQAPAKYMLSDKLWDYLERYRLKHQAKGNGFGFGIVEPEGVTRTLSARYYKDGSEILVRQEGMQNPRRLTIEEARQLMGYEDRFAALFPEGNGFKQVVSDTQAYKQFGNSVVPLLVEKVGEKIAEAWRARQVAAQEEPMQATA